MEKRTEGGVVLPGPGAIPQPVDPNDPTKGNITPVASAIELTAGVTELFMRTETLGQGLQFLAGRSDQMGYELGELLDAVAAAILSEDADEQDEARELLKQYREARAEARAQAEKDAEQEVWKANAEDEPLTPDAG